MEIITGVERRRRWRPEEKLRILAELDQPGAKFNDVARRHDVSRGLLWQWREARGRGRLVVEGVWGATERKSYVRPGSSVSSVAVLGLRSGRSSPRATGSGRVKAYRPSMLMCSKPSGERRAASSSRTS